MKQYQCPNCLLGNMSIFYKATSVPANSCILLATYKEAVDYPRGEIALGCCKDCGFISNVAFDEKLTEYSGRYEETQGFSPTFSAFHRDLASHLIEQYGLKGKDILEIGCGKGEFLTLVAELGGNNCVGFDPGYQEGRLNKPTAGQVLFIQDFYSEKYASHRADFICCKMTLEHVSPTNDFIGMIRRAIGDKLDTPVFFQVPDATRVFKECAFEDIYYEHCSYFTPESLSRLFKINDFEIIDLDVVYDSQYLTIVVKPIKSYPEISCLHENNFEQDPRRVADFTTQLKMKLQRFREKFNDLSDRHQKVVLWGSGSKGVAFLNTLRITNEVEYVVDINPNRQGFFMAGTGQKIVAPEFLKDYQPDLVVVMNSIYVDEIRSQLQDMGLSPEMMAV